MVIQYYDNNHYNFHIYKLHILIIVTCARFLLYTAHLQRLRVGIDNLVKPTACESIKTQHYLN